METTSEPLELKEPVYIVSPQVYAALKPLIEKEKRLKSYKINI